MYTQTHTYACLDRTKQAVVQRNRNSGLVDLTLNTLLQRVFMILSLLSTVSYALMLQLQSDTLCKSIHLFYVSLNKS